MRNLLRATIIAALSLALLSAGLSATAETADAAVPDPVIKETARLLGYMWGDGSYTDGVWDISGPSGTSSLIEELVEIHGGTWVDRAKLRFRLPAQYDWTDWKSGLPDDSAWVTNAVQNPHFLAALMETEASVSGQIYDQSICCVPGYTEGRLIELRDMMQSRGFSTATLVPFNNVDSGRITIDESEWAELRAAHKFVCPVSEAAVRIPGGTDLAGYGNLRWIRPGHLWGDLVRGDCAVGSPVPPAGEQSGSCWVSAVGDEVTVGWTFTLGDASIREDNTFITLVSGRDGSWVSTRTSGEHSYEVRLFAFGVRTDVSCGSVVVGDDVPPSSQCTVSANGTNVLLDWDDFGKTNYSIRRNGSWLVTITDGSTTSMQPGSVDDIWQIRYTDNGVKVTVPCAVDDDPPPNGPCTVSSLDGGVRIEWDEIAGVTKYQVRANGGWLATVEGATSYDDPTGSLASNYVIRYRNGGGAVDLTCT